MARCRIRPAGEMERHGGTGRPDEVPLRVRPAGGRAEGTLGSFGWPPAREGVRQIPGSSAPWGGSMGPEHFSGGLLLQSVQRAAILGRKSGAGSPAILT